MVRFHQIVILCFSVAVCVQTATIPPTTVTPSDTASTTSTAINDNSLPNNDIVTPYTVTSKSTETLVVTDTQTKPVSSETNSNVPNDITSVQGFIGRFHTSSDDVKATSHPLSYDVTEAVNTETDSNSPSAVAAMDSSRNDVSSEQIMSTSVKVGATPGVDVTIISTVSTSELVDQINGILAIGDDEASDTSLDTPTHQTTLSDVTPSLATSNDGADAATTESFDGQSEISTPLNTHVNEVSTVAMISNENVLKDVATMATTEETMTDMSEHEPSPIDTIESVVNDPTAEPSEYTSTIEVMYYDPSPFDVTTTPTSVTTSLPKSSRGTDSSNTVTTKDTILSSEVSTDAQTDSTSKSDSTVTDNSSGVTLMLDVVPTPSMNTIEVSDITSATDSLELQLNTAKKNDLSENQLLNVTNVLPVFEIKDLLTRPDELLAGADVNAMVTDALAMFEGVDTNAMIKDAMKMFDGVEGNGMLREALEMFKDVDTNAMLDDAATMLQSSEGSAMLQDAVEQFKDIDTNAMVKDVETMFTGSSGDDIFKNAEEMFKIISGNGSPQYAASSQTNDVITTQLPIPSNRVDINSMVSEISNDMNGVIKKTQIMDNFGQTNKDFIETPVPTDKTQTEGSVEENNTFNLNNNAGIGLGGQFVMPDFNMDNIDTGSMIKDALSMFESTDANAMIKDAMSMMSDGSGNGMLEEALKMFENVDANAMLKDAAAMLQGPGGESIIQEAMSMFEGMDTNTMLKDAQSMFGGMDTNTLLKDAQSMFGGNNGAAMLFPGMGGNAPKQRDAGPMFGNGNGDGMLGQGAALFRDFGGNLMPSDVNTIFRNTNGGPTFGNTGPIFQDRNQPSWSSWPRGGQDMSNRNSGNMGPNMINW